MKKKPNLPFNKKLVLNRFMLKLLGVKNFNELASLMNSGQFMDIGSNQNERFMQFILQPLQAGVSELNVSDLQRYDSNILALTERLRGLRSSQISWRYFQYLALLLTEIYLDRYFNGREKLLSDLNAYLDNFNGDIGKHDQIEYYTEEDLRKIAFWSATGSGKTLLMHMNIEQYLHYLRKSGGERDLNQILLITPNEGLSKQHDMEFRKSGIRAEMFSKTSKDLFAGKRVQIIEITKLTEKDGDKRVALSAFEGNNLVLVDEGHRGAAGNVWQKNRSELAKSGFTFEYSATFGQAAASNAVLTQEYARSIIFDYSYKFFHSDGFGKDYRIINLKKNWSEEQIDLYLTVCLLAFFQQKMLYKEKKEDVRKFNIENPLWVFVGGSVTKSSDKELPDVMEIMNFFARIVSPKFREKNIENINKIISGKTEFMNEENKNIFSNVIPYISKKERTAENIYSSILREIFRSASSGQLHMEELKGIDGEIALRIGDGKPFGVINVGKPHKLCELCCECENIHVTENKFAVSLFADINEENSPINILIGSKKFSEGWSSWRVSTMGLMNMGKNEGAQIIQLFGRGVRLKGYENSLKRHKALKNYGIEPDFNLNELETLNVYGIHADYMEQFKTFLDIESIATEDSHERIVIPVIPNLKDPNLKVIRVKEGMDYERSGQKSTLTTQEISFGKKIVFDYYPRVQDEIAVGMLTNRLDKKVETNWLNDDNLEFIDLNGVYLELLDYKNIRKMFNINIEKSMIRNILLDKTWYELKIPSSRLIIDDRFFDGNNNNILLWQDIAIALVKKYMESFYKYKKNEWESKFREYHDLSETDPEFDVQFEILVSKSQQQIIDLIRRIKTSIESGEVPNVDVPFGDAGSLVFDRHIFQPLFYSQSEDIKISAPSLNTGEWKFITDLKEYYSGNKEFFRDKELYVLRNMPNAKGTGFFEAENFHPDFIIWLLTKDKQYVTFVDPKGLFHLNEQDKKVKFFASIKDIEKEMGEKDIILNSCIVSVTPYNLVQHWDGGMTQEEFADRHIFFQENKNYIEQLMKSIS